VTLSDTRELFLRELRTILWVERMLADTVIPELLGHVHATDLVWALERHLLETEDQAGNVRTLLVRLHAETDPEESAAFLGLKREHDELMQLLDTENRSLVDIFHTGVIARTEHLEIAAYTGLVQMAKALGVDHEDVLLLRENLEQEQHALEQAEHALAKLLAEALS
jgi:ferritin-like metal-binding protein YciE